MTLTADQCAAATQVIPLILIAFIAERHLGGVATLHALARLVNVLALTLLVVAWAIAFGGIDGGVTGAAGATVFWSTFAVIVVLAAILIADHLLPRPHDAHDDRARQDPG